MSDIVPQETPLKQCTKCKQWQPATTECFPRDKKRRDGLYPYCKRCIRTTPPKEPVPEGQKQCAKCHQIKSPTNEYFSRNRNASDGLQAYCKPCVKKPSLYPSVPEGQRRCTKCKQVYPATVEHFNKQPDKQSGLTSHCKQCVSERSQIRYQRAKELPLREMPPETQVCRECGKEKPLSQFPKYAPGRYGVTTLCQPCTNRVHNRIMQKPEQKVKQAERVKRNYEMNKPEIQKRHRKWKQNNREWVIANSHGRRALKRAIPGTYTPAQIQEQLKRQRYRCYYARCGYTKFERKNGKYIYHVDHTIPISRIDCQPRNEISHLVLACPTCNLLKGAKMPHEWFEGGRLL